MKKQNSRQVQNVSVFSAHAESFNKSKPQNTSLFNELPAQLRRFSRNHNTINSNDRVEIGGEDPYAVMRHTNRGSLLKSVNTTFDDRAVPKRQPVSLEVLS
jgi:hypothetical protein